MIKSLRKDVHNLRVQLRENYFQNTDIETLVRNYSAAIDDILLKLWHPINDDNPICLIAVGGYGRMELQPYSDIDLLILCQTELSQQAKHLIENFIQECWDAGLEIGHNVSTLAHAAIDAHNDITIISTFMEARLLTGNETLYHKFKDALSPQNMWPSKVFFSAKWKEQKTRYHKYDETSYNLEPNVKHGPGGLRDIHMIGWVAKRHYNVRHLSELVGHGFLTQNEYDILKQGQRFLWRICYGLHFINNRREWRLLFDHQKSLAQLFGYHDLPHKLAIEQFMRDYYLTIKNLRQLNDMLLQLFREAILHVDKNKIVELNDNFQLCNGYIEAIKTDLFQSHPEALLEIFLLLARHPEIKGVRASTIRLINEAKFLINDHFRESDANKRLFISILRETKGLSEALQRMNRYRILERYLPIFSDIVGQMQYDLYHVYTVDQHIIFMIRNIERFALVEYRAQFPLCAELMENISKPEILHLGALFHDIAKGRGGDHSELGAIDARNFCRSHQMSEADADLVAWLVENHLLMSVTAQRKDIYDIETIREFVEKVQDNRHLDYLYLLTVADICATNPTLWNSWKDTLLRELHRFAKQLLVQENKIIEPEQVINEKQTAALALLTNTYAENAISTLWQHFKFSYFLREKPSNIAWHTAEILTTNDANKATVAIKQHDLQGATEIFIYAPLSTHLFSMTATVLANNNLSIVEASLSMTLDDHGLATYIILDETNQVIKNDNRVHYIRDTLRRQLQPGMKLPRLTSRRIPRQMRHFSSPITIAFEQDNLRDRTIMDLGAPDRPGLVARVSRAFLDCELILINAKVSTMGERVEDRFIITDQQGHACNPHTLEQLEEKVRNYLG